MQDARSDQTAKRMPSAVGNRSPARHLFCRRGWTVGLGQRLGHRFTEFEAQKFEVRSVLRKRSRGAARWRRSRSRRRFAEGGEAEALERTRTFHSNA